jgi:hypothetical protein
MVSHLISVFCAETSTPDTLFCFQSFKMKCVTIKCICNSTLPSCRYPRVTDVIVTGEAVPKPVAYSCIFQENKDEFFFLIDTVQAQAYVCQR